MQQITLNNEHTLSFEPMGKSVRLIVSRADEELVCRKESLKNLHKFLLADEMKIFKGRLQLDKHQEMIEVIMKDRPIAMIGANNFEQLLNNLK